MQGIRRSSRNIIPPIWHKDYAMSSSNVKYPIFDYISYSNLSKNPQNYVCAVSKTTEPSSYHEGCLDCNWIQVMKEEIDALIMNKTWTLVKLPT